MYALQSPLNLRQSPNLARVGGLSGAMTINLLALGALLLPMVIHTPLRGVRPPPPEPAIEVTEVTHSTPIAMPATISPPVPIEIPPPPIDASSLVAPTSVPTPMDLAPSDSATLPPVDIYHSSVPAAAVNAGLADMTLEYVDTPPPQYPRIAESNGWEGLVLLRVRVGTDGYPIDVEIERSSGRAMLDQAARRTVLAQWRFRPAIRDGVAVEAIGRVPISFALHQR